MTEALFFFIFNHSFNSTGSHVCGCLGGGEETGERPSPSPPHPPHPPGGCVCSGSSGRVGSCSVFHRLQLQHRPTVRKTYRVAQNQDGRMKIKLNPTFKMCDSMETYKL